MRTDFLEGSHPVLHTIQKLLYNIVKHILNARINDNRSIVLFAISSVVITLFLQFRVHLIDMPTIAYTFSSVCARSRPSPFYQTLDVWWFAKRSADVDLRSCIYHLLRAGERLRVLSFISCC